MYNGFIANLLLTIRDDPKLFGQIIEKMEYSDFVDHHERFTEAAKWVYKIGKQ